MAPYRSRRVPTVLSVAALLAVAPLLSGCAGGARGDVPGKLDVVASTDVWGSIAAFVGGSRVSVTSIISDPAQDPHSFEGSSRTLLAVRDADLLVENGGGYDDFMTQLISTSGNDAPLVDAVATSGYVASAGGDEVNEHVWYDLPTVKKVAHEITVDLIELDHRHDAEYIANEKSFDAGLDRLESRVFRVSKDARGTPVSITEPVPAYLLGAMLLHNLTPVDFSRAVEDSGDVSARVLADTLALYAQHRVAALIYNSQTSGPVTTQVEAAARSAGIPVVPVTETLPEGTSYLSWMSDTIARIAAAVTRR
jgi:zinc/manganese transport system substrate-binding protein